MPQEQVHATPVKTTRKKTEQPAEVTPRATEHVTVEDIDDVLADIDSILEDNELEVVQRFVQKGGE